jgi:HEAT repeat protein
MTLARLLADPDENVRETTAAILEKIGPQAILSVVEVLHDDLPVERDRALHVLRHVLQSNPWSRDPEVDRRLFSDGDRGIRLEALRAVFSAGRASAAHINAVGAMLDDPDQDVRLSALTVVIGWDAGTNEQIRELLKAETGVETALNAIARRGPEAAELVPDIIALVEQQKQLEILANFGGLGDKIHMHPRLQAILAALSSLKTAARPAASLLLSRLGELHAGNRILVMATLVDIGAPAADLIPFLTPLLTKGAIDQPIVWRNRLWDEREVMRQTGIVLQRASLEEGRRQAALLIPRLKTADGQVEKTVLYALWGLGPAASEAVPELVSLVPNPNGEVFWHAGVALGEIGPEAAPAVPAFVAAIESVGSGSHDTDGEICERIIEALGKIGPPANSSVPVLLRVIDEPERFVVPDAHSNVAWAPMLRAMAISSVGRINDGSPETLATLQKLIATAPNDTRMAAVKALANMTERAPHLLAELIVLLRSDNASVLGQAALTIGRLSLLDRTATIEPLIRILGFDNPYLRAAAAVALGQIGPDARAALPALRNMERHPEPLPLWRITPPGWKKGMPSYVQIPEIHNLTLQQAAHEAISRIEQ